MKTQNSPLLPRLIFIAVITLIVYAMMIFGPLAQLAAIAGMAPFDLRPSGYGPEEARALLIALGDEGRKVYLGRQLVLDMFYPALLALTLGLLFFMLKPRLRGPSWAVGGIVLAWIAALFDYLENLGIAIMVTQGPDVSGGVIVASGTATILKSGLTSACVLYLIALFLWSKWAGDPRLVQTSADSGRSDRSRRV